MDEGFISDESYGSVSPSKWVEGRPEKSVWTGTKTQGKRQVAVKTFRCPACGYLESYAKEP